MDSITCYRCGREVAPDRLDVEGWVVLHAWEDGGALFVCPDCQTEREAEIPRRLANEGEAEGAAGSPSQATNGTILEPRTASADRSVLAT